MANPTITSTSTTWQDTTTIRALMTWTGGGTGKVRVWLGNSVVKAWTNVSSGSAITFTGLVSSNTYRVEYNVTSGTITATKYDTLFGATPTFSLCPPDSSHPFGGAAFGKQALPGEFYVKNDSKFDGTMKINGDYVWAINYKGIQIGDGTDSLGNAPPGGFIVAPFVSYNNIGVSEGSSYSELRTFIYEWMKFISAHYSINPYSVLYGMCKPGIRCIVQWYVYNSDDKVNGYPRYSMGILIPFGSTNGVYKFGTDNGSPFFTNV